MKVLLFAGTSDARKVLEFLLNFEIDIIVCVATDYAQQFLENQDGYTLLVGRKTEEEINEIIDNGVDIVIDATHPFAEIITKSLVKITKTRKVKYYRIIRDKVDIPDFVIRVSSYEEASNLLRDIKGNILLTTGSKTAEIFAKDKDVRNRLFLRILPMIEGVKKAKELGYLTKNIIALQGPFTKDFNKAMLEQYNIETMVTKESGKTGGLKEKIESAVDLGIRLILISKPEDIGYTLKEFKKIFRGKHEYILNRDGSR